jgi:hypothetical protein
MKLLLKHKKRKCYPRHTLSGSLRSLSVYEQSIQFPIILSVMIGRNYKYNALSFRSRRSYLGVSSASHIVDAISDGEDYYDRERNSPHCLANHVTIDRYLKANKPVKYEESEE